MSADAYPLAWPEGWPRTRYDHQKSEDVFHGKTYGALSRARVIGQLMNELKLLRATNVILSTNVRLKTDGFPYSDERPVGGDCGVAIYFMLKKRPMVMAMDRYRSVAGNIRSLTLAIEAMRQLERHGGGTMMERAFTGFAALSPPNWKKPWREVFGVKPDWKGDITALYREKARDRHPDVGGADTLMAELNVAYAEAKAELSP